MTKESEIILKFHKFNHQNDINIIEQLIYPIFSKKTQKDTLYWKEIRSLFLSAMKNAKLTSFQRNVFWWYVNRKITKGLQNGTPLIEVEYSLRKFIRRFSNDEKDKKPLAIQRAKMNFENVKNYIIGEKILDLGAGDGLLALEIKKLLSKEVVLVDILDYNQTNLPLILYNPEDKVPLADNEVDTTILYTVLHHSNDPKHLLDEARRVTKQRLIIKEAFIENEINRMTNSFFDWFYNRVVGDEDINVPLNFLKVEEWEKLLNSYGFDVIETKYMGIDEPVIPEYQIFIIADKTP
jgi:ubiquinone/menaquinone biosynthesis C-methylase UbiE